MQLNNPNPMDSARVRRVVLIALIVVAIVLVTVFAREGDGGSLHSAQSKASSAAAPAASAGAKVGNAFDLLSLGLENVTADKGTISSLRKQNEELRAMVAEGEEYRQKCLRLEALLDLKDEYSVDSVGASIVGRSTQAWNQTVTIDKGSSAGIETGMTVMGTTGVIGQVVGVSERSATVRLITDPQSGVAALVQSSRDEGIIRGSLEGLLYLEDMDVDAEVQTGDVILTSGLGGSYTSGLIIGTVVKVESAAGSSSRRAVVSPNGDIQTLEEVIVVLGTGGSVSTESDGSEQTDDGTGYEDVTQ